MTIDLSEQCDIKKLIKGEIYVDGVLIKKKGDLYVMKYDKKKLGSRIRYVLPKGIGNAQLDIEVSKEVLSKVLGDLS